MRKRFLTLFVFFVFLFGVWGFQIQTTDATQAGHRGLVLSKELSQKIEQKVLDEISSKGKTTFWVILKDKADLSSAFNIKKDRERGDFVYQTLRSVADKSQAGLRAFLATTGVKYIPFWIANTIEVRDAGAALLKEIAARPEVDRIIADGAIELPKPTPGIGGSTPATTEWGLDNIQAPQVWSTFGDRGEGIVVANVDTGFQFDHPALVAKYRGNLGGGNFDHNYNWFDPSAICSPGVPCDNNSHGTHTMGTMVGDDGDPGTNQIGVAPHAQFMGCKGCETNSCSFDALNACGQFILAPTDVNGNNPDTTKRPHIVNNSWGGGPGDPFYQPVVDAWVASGIYPQFSAGNGGPGCNTVGSPGDYINTYSAAAYDINNVIAGFSSRGPGAFGGEIKPNIAAPGVNVRSSVSIPPNGYANFNGTSMASPHVAGTIALMWSAAPSLVRDIAATRAILDATATDVSDTSCGGTGADNNVWGEGRLNALQAVTQSPICNLGTLDGTVTDSGTAQPIAGANVDAVGAVNKSTTTDANGNYSMDLCEGDYDVTASAFGYLPETVPVTITTGNTTTQDFQLDQAPSSTVTGTVFDNSGHGWGLYAQIDIDGFPGSPVFTNPSTGVYSVDLPQGTIFTFHVNAVVPGYFGQQRDVDPGANPTEDFGLDIDGGACNAPGYGFGSSSPLFSDDFESGFGNWGMDGLWNPENESDTCGQLVAPFPSPTNDAYYGIDGQCTFDNGSANSGSLTMVTPVSVPTTGKATLTFYSYEQTECGGASCPYDGRFVEVSNDGGSSWAQVGEGDTENTWYQKSIDLAPYSGQNILVRFHFDTLDSVGNGFFGWMVDSVDMSVTQCETIPGGLVVGNVYDLNTGVGLNGGKVTSVDEPNDQATTFATPDDPNTDDGLYVLFSSLTGAHDFTASKNQYGSQTLNVDVAADDIVVQNFQLGTGHLVATPSELEATVDLGSQLTQQLTITNDGNADGTFEIQEGNGLVSFKIKGVNLPKAKIHKGDRKVKAKSGPTSVMSLRGAPKSKLKGLFPAKGPTGGGWSPTSTMANPVIRYGHAQCDETPDSFYVISGVDSGFGLASSMQRYDADTDTWTLLASYPNPAEAPTAVCFEGRIYVANGAFTSNEFFIYDIATDTWLSGASLPRFVEGGAMGAADGKIYLIGGDDDFQPASGISNEVDVYDIATDTWTGTGSPMPEGVSNAGMVQSGPFVYVVGGWNSGSPGVNSTMTQRYDMSGDTWETGPTFDLGNSDFALAATDTALYSAGGDAFGGGFFDPTTAAQRLDLSGWPGGSWADLGSPLPEGRLANNAGFCTTAVSGGEVWSTGGLDGNTFSVDGKNQYHTTGEGCAGGGIDVPWISENPVTATVPANGGSVVVDVTYDASQVSQPGDYFAHLTIKTDTPYPAQKVNVTMHVPLPANFGILQGTVNGLGQCDTPGGPIEGATVFIDGQLEDFTLTTDENGFYTWALDAANSPITMTVSANKFIQEVRPGVTVTPQNTTTEDFTLRLDAACLSVNPTALEDTVPFGGQDTQQFTITNDGGSDANFELTEANGLSIVKIKQNRHGAGAPVRRIKGNFSPLSKVAFEKANGGKLLNSGFKRGPQDAPWTDIANYPNAIMDSAAAEIDGLIYNAAGLDAGLSFLNTLFVYDPGADSWTQLASMTNQRERPAVAAIDGLLYVTNGWDPGGSPTGALEIYDPATDTWSSGAPNPSPMGGGSDGLNFDGKFYVIGGCDSGNCGHTDVVVYDPSTDSWSSAADYPEPISWQACGDIGGLIYCAGGTAGSSTTANAYVYDPGTDSWSPVAPIPQDQWGMGYVASDDKLYISGGVTDGFSTITNEGFSYDPSSDSWTAIENSNNTLYRGAGACGFYKIGGSSGGFSPVPNSEVYPGLTNCGGSTDVPWLSENPVSGTIPADGGQVVIDVNYDASQVLQPGDFFAHINVKGNSPGPTPKVDVTMHVPVPPNFGLLNGTVTGLGQCDLPGGPISGATVFVDGPQQDFTLETDANGQYSWYFDAANSPVDITVSAPGYIGQTQTGIVMNAGQTTTVDFTLSLDAPCLSVAPTSLDQTLPLGGLATQQITIMNTGAGDANYKINESGGLVLNQKTLPKAVSRADKSRMAMTGPTSVRTLKGAPAAKLKALFPGKSVPNAWIPGAANPVPVIRYGHAQCDDTPESFYVISGVDTSFGLSNALSRYDADTNAWTSLAPIPSASEAPTAVCFEGKIYVAVGAFTSNEFQIYDIASDSWSSGATLPRFVEGAAMGALDGQIYLMGGDDDFQPASGVSNEVNIYDIATDTWTGTGSPMPAATAQAGFVQAGTFVYVVGGWGLSAPGANETTTQRYDMSSDTWETGPSFDVAVADFAIAGTDTALYAMGGDQNGGGFFDSTNTAQRLDLSSWPGGSWADLGDPLTSARQANQAGFCTTAFTGGEVWTTDAFSFGTVSGVNEYRNTGEGCATGGGDVPWLSENPSEGVVPAGGSVVVDVTFDASQVAAEGDYFAQLKISGNSPGASPTVDVALHVVGGGCDYAQDFNDATMEWIEEKATVTQPGDGFLHLTPLKKKAVAVADSSFAGATTGVFNFDIQFTGGTDAKNWIYTHRVDKKNQMEVLFKVEQGKVVVKDRGPGGVQAKAKADFALAPNTPYSVSILYDGTAYAVTINGTAVITGFSPVGALPSANIGAAAKNNSMLLDNVCVIEQ